MAAPDLPGYGGSPPIAPDDYAVPALAGSSAGSPATSAGSRSVLAGHSWGGAIACHLAAAHPDLVAALILVDSGHLDYADTPGADLSATSDDLIAQGEETGCGSHDRPPSSLLERIPTTSSWTPSSKGWSPTAAGLRLAHAGNGARARRCTTSPVAAEPDLAGDRLRRLSRRSCCSPRARPGPRRQRGGRGRVLRRLPKADVRWVDGCDALAGHRRARAVRGDSGRLAHQPRLRRLGPVRAVA